MVSLVNLFWILCKSAGPKRVAKLASLGIYVEELSFSKKTPKKKMDNLGFFFGAFLGTILGPILGSDRPKRGQDEPKRAIRSFKEPNAAFSKTLKNLEFFSVFGSRGLPREPQEAREGSQETPKETPKGGPKIGQKVVKK